MQQHTKRRGAIIGATALAMSTMGAAVATADEHDDSVELPGDYYSWGLTSDEVEDGQLCTVANTDEPWDAGVSWDDISLPQGEATLEFWAEGTGELLVGFRGFQDEPLGEGEETPAEDDWLNEGVFINEADTHTFEFTVPEDTDSGRLIFYVGSTLEDPNTDREVCLQDISITLQPYTPTTFTDVPPTHPFYNEITWLADNGITEGYEDGTYRPQRGISRQAMAAFIYRLDGDDTYVAPDESPFWDVSTDSTFYTEIAWLYEAGIAQGYEDGSFQPSNRMSRQAMAAFIHNMVDPVDYTAPDESPFTDVATDHVFFTEIAWMYDAGISTGYEDGTYRTTERVSRQAMAAFIYRLVTHDDYDNDNGDNDEEMVD